MLDICNALSTFWLSLMPSSSISGYLYIYISIDIDISISSYLYIWLSLMPPVHVLMPPVHVLMPPDASSASVS